MTYSAVLFVQRILIIHIFKRMSIDFLHFPFFTRHFFADGDGSILTKCYVPIYNFTTIYISLILLIAATVFSCVPNAVRRKYPSPLGPNPEPGVPTTFAFSSR